MNMPMILFCLALSSTGLCNAQEESTKPAMSVSPAPVRIDEQSLEILINSIESSSSDDYFAVTIELDQRMDLGVIRDTVNYLNVPGMTAFVEFGRSKIPIGMGTLYPDDSYPRGVCEAKISAKLSRSQALQNIPPEQWLIREFRVYGSADVIRELVSGTNLPPGRITNGARQDRRYEDRMVEVRKREVVRKMQLPSNFTAPATCERFVELVDAPILLGMPIFRSQAEVSMNPAALLRQELADRAPETPVTLMLNFKSPLSVATLASLVYQYEIDGMSAELVPSGNSRILVSAELSIHGGSFQDQIDRTECSMRFGDNIGDSYDTKLWFASRAQVSVTVENAWQLISYQNLESARLLANFAPGELTRLENYYHRRATEIVSISGRVIIPDGCERFFQTQK